MDKKNQVTDERKTAAVDGNDRSAYERTPFGRRKIVSNSKLRMVPKILMGVLVASALYMYKRFGFGKLIPVRVTTKS